MLLPDNILNDFITRNSLPDTFCGVATNYYLPLARWIAGACEGSPHSVIGINGAQGSGKSTLAAFVRMVLSSVYGLRVVVVSIDDIYLTRSQRLQLGRDVHPLLETRGVPGTHDIELGTRLLDSLEGLAAGNCVRIPGFDKLMDDRLPKAEWDEVTGPIDIVLFEGWCVGSVAQPPEALLEPVNNLEAELDEGGHWRQYVNQQLEQGYSQLFSRLKKLIYLKVPDLDSVRTWRHEQEDKLAAIAASGAANGPMTPVEVGRFVEYFERITLDNLRDLPGSADAVVSLNRNHLVEEVIYKSDQRGPSHS